jgi:ribosomal protein S27E
MRLPVDKIYRAFPELDRFSDAQCRDFVERAIDVRASLFRAVLWARIFWAIVVIVLGIASLIPIGIYLNRGGRRIVESDLYFTIIAPVLLILAAIIGVGGQYLIRDYVLRRTIRDRILTAKCPRCEYGLLGLPCIGDGDASAITCPECGTTTMLLQMGMTRAEFDALRPTETSGAVREGG